MSHNYLFTLYALILWLTIKWHQSQKWVHGLLLAFFCGIAIISRLSELVCLLIPLFWGVYNKATLIEKVRLLKKNKFQVISFLLVLFVTISPQLIYWKIHTGHFLFYSYANNPGEGFDFSSPYWREFLFSFRKGWLIYTPVMGFAVLGFLALFKYNRSIFYALFIYFILNLYIVSSWSCWWYAQSFSQRAVIQSYPVMAVTLGYFILWLRNQKKYLRYPVIGMMICFLLLNLFQSFQTVKGVLSGDRMTRNYYFATFGKLKVSQADTRLLLVNRSFIGKEQVEHDSDYTPRRLVAHTFENDGGEISGFARTGDLSRKMDSLNPYAPGWTSPYYLLTRKDHAWLRLSAYVYPTKSFKESPFGCVAHFIHQGKAYKYVFIPTDTSGLAMNKWNKVVFEYLTPEVRSRQDTLKMYLFLKGKYPVYCDDITVDVLEPKFDNH